MNDILNYIIDKRGRSLKIGWGISVLSIFLLNIINADDNLTIGQLKEQSADKIIILTYILYAGIHIKNSLRTMSSKMITKEDFKKELNKN